ncbi:S-methyl-5'-thioadenosine phosphorylase [Diabrotica virgifera virgifera]|uniref:S-methyl-5'-thioadenosine phosphorylase n=1 Tax=Diabrotica virgifera virgifera TaxID=50390 RepID=A0A6P7F2Z8_DIAVI|nr:S-methyl-5'-thioadenosine phosphorylase [Diabrotica virgifera virgifera]
MALSIKVGIIGGTGFDDPDILKNRKEKAVSTPFGNPSDSLILGEIDGVPCVLLARHGRKHDIMPSDVNYRANIWALKEEGCTHIIATTAVGSLQEHYKPGSLALTDSFIDRTTNRKQTFYDGEPGHPVGVSHIPMEPAYCPKTRELILEVAEKLGISIIKTGTMVIIEGPRFSTKAESKMYRSWGGDIIGMTQVPEVVLAKEAAICYANVSLVTDYDCWRDSGVKVCVPEVMKTFRENISKVIKLVLSVVPKIGETDWHKTITELKEVQQSSVMLPH